MRATTPAGKSPASTANTFPRIIGLLPCSDSRVNVPTSRRLVSPPKCAMTTSVSAGAIAKRTSLRARVTSEPESMRQSPAEHTMCKTCKQGRLVEDINCTRACFTGGVNFRVQKSGFSKSSSQACLSLGQAERKCSPLHRTHFLALIASQRRLRRLFSGKVAKSSLSGAPPL
jgi:hypothetical protein